MPQTPPEFAKVLKNRMFYKVKIEPIKKDSRARQQKTLTFSPLTGKKPKMPFETRHQMFACCGKCNLGLQYLGCLFADQIGFVQHTGQFLHPKHKVYFRP